MNPFTKDHHNLNARYVRPSSHLEKQAEVVPEDLTPQEQLMNRNFRNLIANHYSTEAKNNWNAALNEMTPWEKLRLYFTRGIGKLLDSFGYKNHNFHKKWRDLNQRVGGQTLSNMTGVDIHEDSYDNYLGDLENWDSIDSGLSYAISNQDSRFNRFIQPHIENTREALNEYTRVRGAQENKWVGAVPFYGDKLQQREAFNRLQNDPEYQQEFMNQAFNPNAEVNAYKYHNAGQPFLISPARAEQIYSDKGIQKVKPKDMFSAIGDAHAWGDEPQPYNFDLESLKKPNT